MSRNTLFRSGCFPYYISSRSNDLKGFYVSQEDTWNIFLSTLGPVSERRKVKIHSLLLTGRSFNLLLTTPEKSVDEFMHLWLCKIAREILKRSGRINHVFGTRYHWSSIQEPSEYAYTYKYLQRIPVNLDLSKNVEDYPYNLENIKTPRKLFHPAEEFFLEFIPANIDSKYEWLNTPCKKESEDLVRMALRRNRFQFTSNSNLQKCLRELKATYGVEKKKPAPFQY
jgi:hypothetical protein